MAQSRLSMRKIRDVLRLSAAGLSKRQIAASLGIGPTAAGACLRRARAAGIGWPLPDDLADDALERCRHIVADGVREQVWQLARRSLEIAADRLLQGS